MVLFLCHKGARNEGRKGGVEESWVTTFCYLASQSSPSLLRLPHHQVRTWLRSEITKRCNSWIFKSFPAALATPPGKLQWWLLMLFLSLYILNQATNRWKSLEETKRSYLVATISYKQFLNHLKCAFAIYLTDGSLNLWTTPPSPSLFLVWQNLS